MVKFQRGQSSTTSSSSSSSVTSNGNNIVVVDLSFEARLNSPLSWKTLNKIRAKKCRRTERRAPGGTVKFFDQDFPCYNWLIPGWLAEERRMPTGRLYRYYYDPAGNLYRTKDEVLFAWKQCGLISLDHNF